MHVELGLNQRKGFGVSRCRMIIKQEGVLVWIATRDGLCDMGRTRKETSRVRLVLGWGKEKKEKPRVRVD